MLLRLLKAWLPVAAICVGIFLLSADSSSGHHSDMILGWILTLAHSNTTHLRHLLDPGFRKFAHVFVYFWLGAFAYRGFAMGGTGFRWDACARALIFCVLYAASDEYHQSFVATRGPSVHDVFIDLGGAVLAMILIWLWQRQKRGRVPMARPQVAARPGVSSA